jgi:hypothetical protein
MDDQQVVRIVPMPDEATAVGRARVWLRNRQEQWRHRSAFTDKLVT